MIVVLIGICLIILGFIWFKYELSDMSKRKKKGDKYYYSGKPKMFLGVYIILAMAITMIIRALYN